MKKLIFISIIFFVLISKIYTQSLVELNTKAGEYYKKGDYQNAIIYLEKAIKQAETELGKENRDYASLINNLAFLYLNLGQYAKAEPLFTEALRIIKETLGEEHPSYAATLNNLATLYSDIGQYDKSELLHIEALKIRKEVLGERHPDYAQSLNNLAILYQTMKQYSKAEPLYIDALRIKKEIYGEKNQSYATSLNNLAALYLSMGEYDKSEMLHKDALKIRKEILGEKNPDYSQSLNNLAALYHITKKYDKAEPLYLEALAIDKEVFGEKHPKYATDLDNLSLLYKEIGKYDKAESLYKESNRNYLSQIESYYPVLSETEKMKFLKTIDYHFDFFYSFALMRIKENPSISSDILQLRISTKGIILSSTSTIKNRIMKSGNDRLIENYDKFIKLRKEIAVAYTLSIQEQKQKGINLEVLENEANELEKQLSSESEDYKSEVDKKNISWQDIQRTLKSDEVMIEFLNFRYLDKILFDSTYYCALIVKNGNKYPSFIKLCNETELSEYLKVDANKENSYVRNKENSKEIYNLIWKPLEKYLQGSNTVYISPSGILNKISFSALYSGEDSLISDKFSLRYVGNLKDIVSIKDDNPIKSINGFSAMIFGGADFNLDSSNMLLNAEKYRIEQKNNVYLNIPDTLKEQNKRDLNERGGWGYLKGTLNEAENIKNIFDKNGLYAKEFIGADASEDALKSLSRTKDKKSPSILHIATHGFFFPEPPKEYGTNQMIQKVGSELIKKSENPLLRSGIILAGVNHFWQYNKAIDGAEDGILTAFEVSNMDLQNTELVVLSACETGLGDIKGGEGVYGLQRAFKVAGVKTIIMSLWKVPDKETVELMELFYTNWLGGMTKHDAFANAQKEMRKKYAPYYWAAFVMVE
jgi:CHAT domain-containing protein